LGHLRLIRDVEAVPMQIFGHQVMVGATITKEMFLEWYGWGEELGLSDEEIWASVAAERVKKLLPHPGNNPD
jgi:hypothetical protein